MSQKKHDFTLFLEDTLLKKRQGAQIDPTVSLGLNAFGITKMNEKQLIAFQIIFKKPHEMKMKPTENI